MDQDIVIQRGGHLQGPERRPQRLAARLGLDLHGEATGHSPTSRHRDDYGPRDVHVISVLFSAIYSLLTICHSESHANPLLETSLCVRRLKYVKQNATPWRSKKNTARHHSARDGVAERRWTGGGRMSRYCSCTFKASKHHKNITEFSNKFRRKLPISCLEADHVRRHQLFHWLAIGTFMV